MRHSAISALLDALAPDSLPKEGMMRIVDGHKLADMGRMTLRWLWEDPTGYAGSLRSGQRAANVMTLIQSAKINGIDPQAYLSDVLERMPTAKQSDLNGLLPHNWQPTGKV